MNTLSPRESEMLATIVSLRTRLGQMPTRQEIADSMGQAPGGNQRRIFYGLIDKGRIRIKRRVTRGIVIVR